MSNEAKTSVQREAPVDETDGLAKHADAIEKQVEAVSAALARARKTRLGIFLAFLIVALAGVYAFYKMADDFQSEENLNDLTQRVQKHLDDNTDRYINEVKTLVDESYPVLKDAMLEQAKEDAPKYSAALDQQRAELLQNLTTRLEEQVTDHYKQIMVRHRGILKEQFPDLTDDQLGRIAINLEAAAKKLVEKYYVDRMSQELEAMYQTWDQFPVADDPGPNDPKLEDQLVGLMLEIMTIKLKSSEQASIIGPETF